MATIPLSFRPTGIRASASSGHRKPDRSSRKASSASWWTPLFGWSSDLDYIGDDGNNDNDIDIDPSQKPRNGSARSQPRYAPGCFTEEKARQLRMKTMETAVFHDIMYHSSIASRLASDLPNRSDL